MSRKTLYHRVGYWRQAIDSDEQLPWPEVGSLSHEESEKLAAWLEGGDHHLRMRGMSICRVCGKWNGNSELVRGSFVYPDGLAHYVRDHRCAVPGLPDKDKEWG